jgi:hypothetical protein
LRQRGVVAVISIWDESSPVSKLTPLTESQGTDLANIFGDEKFIRSQSVVARVVAGETLLVPIRGKVGDLGSIYSFNGTGTLIWKLLESPKTVSQLVSGVAQEYDIDPAQAECDVANFVGEMKAVGLVEVPAPMAMTGD